MDQRWRTVANDVGLAWAPMVVMFHPWLFSTDEILPFDPWVSVPLLIASGLAVIAYHRAHDRDTFPPWLADPSIPRILAAGGIFLIAVSIGFYFRPQLLTIGVFAVVGGQAIGTTLYRLIFGILRPIPEQRPRAPVSSG